MKILILDPHYDDWLDCSGTISKVIDTTEIFYVGFSPAVESLPEGFTKEDYISETKTSLGVMGIENIHLLDFSVRNFPHQRQEILQYMVDFRPIPDLVMCPSTFDYHQDHSIICQEAIRAFSKKSTMYGYDMPWNVIHSNINHYTVLDRYNIDKKIKCASFYKSQIHKSNNCLTPDFIESLAMVRGNRIGVQYAEGFEVIISRS